MMGTKMSISEIVGYTEFIFRKIAYSGYDDSENCFIQTAFIMCE
jgi:hypothetical protein